LASTTVIDSNNHTATTVRDDGSTVTSKDGKVVDTTDPLELPSSTPDADRPTTLPSLGDLLKDLDQAHHPSHDGTTSNVAGDDIPGTVSAVNVSGQFVEHPRHDGPADPGNPASGIGDEGRPNGSPGEVGPGASGNLINDLNQTSQSSGPEERNAQPQIKTDPTGHSSGGQQGNGSDQNGTGSHQVTLTARPNETPAQHLAQELRDAVDSTHAGEPTKAAQSVEAAHAGHDIASALASTPGGHDNGAFADLLRLAQNPAQSGLVPPPIAAAHDAIAALQLSALGDLAGHAGDVHRVDDFHATALALPVAAHADVTHVTAAVVDHHGHH
jgi:hypothetical protein